MFRELSCHWIREQLDGMGGDRIPGALYSASKARGLSTAAMSSSPEQVSHLQLPQHCDFVVACLSPLSLAVPTRDLEDGAHLYPFLAGNTKELRVGAATNRRVEPD